MREAFVIIQRILIIVVFLLFIFEIAVLMDSLVYLYFKEEG